MKDSKVFVCYSMPMSEYLQSCGFRYEVIGLHPETKKTFHVYIKNEELNEKLKMWGLGIKQSSHEYNN